MPGPSAAVWLRLGILVCALAIPRFAHAAGAAALCEDDESADVATDARQPVAPAAEASAHLGMVGSEAPDFTLKDAAGHTVHLRDLRGKVVVIDFWQSECPSSRAEMPYLQQMHDQYGDKTVAVLGLNVGEDAAHVAEFARDSAYTFPLLVGADPDVAAKYSVTIYPMTFVIDRNGKVVFGGSPADEPGALLKAVKSAVAKKN